MATATVFGFDLHFSKICIIPPEHLRFSLSFAFKFRFSKGESVDRAGRLSFWNYKYFSRYFQLSSLNVLREQFAAYGTFKCLRMEIMGR